MAKKKTKKKKENSFFEDYSNLMEDVQKLKKEKENPFFNSKYVELKDVLQEGKRVCIENNFIFTQRTDVEEMEIEGHSVKINKRKNKKNKVDYKGNKVNILITTLIHKSGKEIKSKVIIPAEDRTDPQKIAAGLTYMRRYSITNLLGIEEEDDDGNQASGKKSGGRKYKTKDNDEPNPFEKTIKAINASKTLERIGDIKEKIEGGSNFSKKQKEALLKIVKARSKKIADKKDDDVPVIDEEEIDIGEIPDGE